MPVVSLSVWDIAPEDVEHTLGQAAKVKAWVMANGAEDARVGQIQTGEHTGKWLMSIRYPNMEAFGKASDLQATDPQVQAMVAETKGTLVFRTLVRGIDIG